MRLKSSGRSILCLFLMLMFNVSCAVSEGVMLESSEKSEESEPYPSIETSVSKTLDSNINEDVVSDTSETKELNASAVDNAESSVNTSLVATNITYNATVSEHEIECTARNLTENETLQVKLVNSSVLMDYLKAHSNTTKSECVLVMFYYRWCVFSTNAAVYYNALARIYPQLHVLAIDAYIHNSINMRFGLVGVPSVLLFHNGKVVGKHNDSEPSIDGFVSFIHKATGLVTKSELIVTDEDKFGPVPTEPEPRLDYVLLISCLFIAISVIYLFVKSSLFQRIMESVRNTWREAEAQHEHLD